MEKLEKELATLKAGIDHTNPYMGCLAELLHPPTKKYISNLILYYESFDELTGRKRDVVQSLILTLKKKKLSA